MPTKTAHQDGVSVQPNLTPAERAALPVVEWEAPAAPQLKHLNSTNTLGTWFIGHPPLSTHGVEPVEVAYQLPMEDGEDFIDVLNRRKELAADDPERARLWAKTSRQEVARIYNQDYAVLFVEKALRCVDDRSAEEIMIEDGFEFAHELAGHHGKPATRVLRKHDRKGGFFSVYLSDVSFHLTHEIIGKEAQGWENLIIVHTTTEGPNGQDRPLFLSPHVAHLMPAAAQLAVYFTEHWAPEPPKPRRRKP